MTFNKGARLAGIIASIAVCALAMVGQTAGRAAPKNDAAADTSKDDILILVNLTAKELKFDQVPNPRVEFPGTGDRATVWVTDRFNLPDKVEPGVTYRNIGITLRISSRFADIDRIVREALGEDAPALPSAVAPATAVVTQPGTAKQHLSPVAKRTKKVQ